MSVSLAVPRPESSRVDWTYLAYSAWDRELRSATAPAAQDQTWRTEPFSSRRLWIL